MNSWNSEVVHSLYEKQNVGFLTHFDGKTRMQHASVAGAFRQLVAKDGASPDSKKTLERAREIVKADKSPRPIPYQSPSWGVYMQMLSELGKTKELQDLLEYADTHLNPTWENGGLHYPRNDQVFDGDGNLIHMEPHSGNSGIGYARLNVKDGQKKMWEHPWTHEELQGRPWIEGATLADGVDFLRGEWDENASALVVTLKRATEGETKVVPIVARNLSAGFWAVYIRGKLTKEHHLKDSSNFTVEVQDVGFEEVDVVFLKLSAIE